MVSLQQTGGARLLEEAGAVQSFMLSLASLPLQFEYRMRTYR
jgi:hypothetical protein